MTTYRTSDGTVVKTENAVQSWEEGTRWDGNNHVSLATGSQWDHETLYKTRKGRYWIERTSQWQGSTPHAEWVSKEEACRWLLAGGRYSTLPDDLAELEEAVSE